MTHNIKNTEGVNLNEDRLPIESEHIKLETEKGVNISELDYSKEKLLEFAQWFEDVANDKVPLKTSLGLCFNFKAKFNKRLHIVLENLKIDWANWGHFSGSQVFPVYDRQRHEYDIRTRCQAEKKFFHTRNVYIGEYGELRRELAHWIAEQIKERL